MQLTSVFIFADTSISVTCGSTLQSSTAKPSDIITTTENGYKSSTVAKGNFFTKTSPDAVSTYSNRDLESIQPPSTTEEIPCMKTKLLYFGCTVWIFHDFYEWRKRQTVGP